MKNYISINGKKIELTDVQIEQLHEAGIVKRNPFARVEKEERYYVIDSAGGVESALEQGNLWNEGEFNVANYCTDLKIVAQRALHETLNRLLWRFSMENGGDEIDWNDATVYKYYIIIDYALNDKKVVVGDRVTAKDIGVVYFKNQKIAQKAIEKIVKPFIAKNPEFEW